MQNADFRSLDSSGNASGLDLLPGVVTRPNEGSGLDVPESHRQSFLPQRGEFVGRVLTVHREVIVGRTQVLAEREDVDVHLSEVPHD